MNINQLLQKVSDTIVSKYKNTIGLYVGYHYEVNELRATFYVRRNGYYSSADEALLAGLSGNDFFIEGISICVYNESGKALDVYLNNQYRGTGSPRLLTPKLSSSRPPSPGIYLHYLAS